MKKIKIIFPLLIVTLAFFSSCKKEDNSVINKDVSSGKWRVSYYYDNSKDETYKFNTYEFEFGTNGLLNIYNSSGNSNGTWSINSSSNKFNIYAGNANPLEDLNDDWMIIENTSSKIRLKDDNTTKVEELHFEKN